MFSQKNLSAEGLVKSYLGHLREALKNEANINDAVVYRATIIVDPEVSEKNNGTLRAISDQIDEATGNRKEDASFRYHGDERALREMSQYVDEGLSDWSKIAFVAAYFQAGAHTQQSVVEDLSAKRLPSEKFKEEMASALNVILETRWIVANELRQTAIGFTEPSGYQVNQATDDKIKELEAKTAAIAELASKRAEFSEKLKTIQYEITPHKAKVETKKTALTSKLDLISKAVTAIATVEADADVKQFNETIKALKGEEMQRPKSGMFSHPVTTLIQKKLDKQDKLQSSKERLVKHSEHLNAKKAVQVVKVGLLDEATAAINKYKENRNLKELQATVADLVHKDSERPKTGMFSHPTTAVLQKLNTVITEEVQKGYAPMAPTAKKLGFSQSQEG